MRAATVRPDDMKPFATIPFIVWLTVRSFPPYHPSTSTGCVPVGVDERASDDTVTIRVSAENPLMHIPYHSV